MSDFQNRNAEDPRLENTDSLQEVRSEKEIDDRAFHEVEGQIFTGEDLQGPAEPSVEALDFDVSGPEEPSFPPPNMDMQGPFEPDVDQQVEKSASLEDPLAQESGSSDG